MTSVQIIGGLGNQMFQYAYARGLQYKGYDISLDLTAIEAYNLHGGYGLDKYNISLKSSNNKKCILSFFEKVLVYFHLHPSVRKEKELKFNPNYLSPQKYKCLIGYFQNENYFKEIRHILLKEFTLNFELSEYTKKIHQIIKNYEGATISIHIRRGDYITQKENSIYAKCSVEYYLSAIKYFEQLYTNVRFLFFSDDMIWVKQNFPMKNAIHIISEEQRLPHEDIFLMSSCNHNIIANSTFSWWGAWLNQHPDKKVIAPNHWFETAELQKQSHNIVPKDWIRLKN